MQLSSTNLRKSAITAANGGSRFRDGSDALAQSKDELMSAFSNLLNEGRAFLKSTSGISGEAVEDARERFAARLADARSRWGGVSDSARTQTRRAALVADDYVRSQPWVAAGIAAGVAFVIAVLASRRS